MNKMKLVATGISVALSVMMLVGCGSLEKKEVASKENGKYSIVCTTFPQYDWVREILGDHKDTFEVSLLLDNGVDLHSYQPTAGDITKIATADLFIYVGGESDGWVEDALKEATNKNMKVINMLEMLGDGAKEEELVEGMQAEEEHGHDHEGEEHHEEEYHEDEEHPEGEKHHHDETTHDESEEERPEYDEHIWLSVQNAMALTESIAKAIEEMDLSHEEVYKSNAESYLSKLKELDKQYQEAVEAGHQKTILFGDRFPFRYLVEDYNLDYYAAFLGCSAETEASFETITFLANKVDELGLSSILVLENSNEKIAQTIKQNTKDKDQEILVMDSLQSITEEKMRGNVTYYSIMEKNLEVLKKALQ